jgi:integrase/recombinase XerD
MAHVQKRLGHSSIQTTINTYVRRSGQKKFTPVPSVMRAQPFVRYLNILAAKFDICDFTGKRWKFQSHQFRHTVATRMINNGVPQHIVQRYLGHESPQMTAMYAHIHDSTLRTAIVGVAYRR